MTKLHLIITDLPGKGILIATAVFIEHVGFSDYEDKWALESRILP